MADGAPGRAMSKGPDKNDDAVHEPALLLGVSRAPELREMSLWLALKMWLRGATPPPRQVNLPRPPRSVLAARTPTALGPEDEDAGERRRASGRR